MTKELTPEELSELRGRKKVSGVGINDASYAVNRRGRGICPYYRSWKSILDRCYGTSNRPPEQRYKNVTVCDEWLTFMNYRAWMMFQDWKGKTIDKDLRGDGTIYSPDTCCFLSRDENSRLIGTYKKRTGVKPTDGGWYIQLKMDHKLKYFGYFKDKSEAYLQSAKHRASYLLSKILYMDNDELAYAATQRALRHVIFNARKLEDL